MRFEDLVGQERAIAVLRNALRRDRVAHAYLFSGPESVGKSTAALIFAAALNCEAAQDSRPCGECRSCQLIARGNHPDVRLIAPAAGKSVIPIQEMRESFVYDVSLKPILGRYKVYLLDHIERTAFLAMHTILKALEEPPPNVVTILVTDYPEGLPPTIPSRCQKVTFQLAGTDAIAGKLAQLGLDETSALALARLSGGRVAWAMRAAQRPEVLAARRALLDLCAEMQSRGLPASLRIADEIKAQAGQLVRKGDAGNDDDASPDDPAEASTEPSFGSDRALRVGHRLRAELPWCLDVMVSWYRDLLAVGEGSPLMNPDYEQALHARLGGDLPHQAECAIEDILEAKHAVQRNANIDVALEALVIGLVGGCD